MELLYTSYNAIFVYILQSGIEITVVAAMAIISFAVLILILAAAESNDFGSLSQSYTLTIDSELVPYQTLSGIDRKLECLVHCTKNQVGGCGSVRHVSSTGVCTLMRFPSLAWPTLGHEEDLDTQLWSIPYPVSKDQHFRHFCYCYLR